MYYKKRIGIVALLIFIVLGWGWINVLLEDGFWSKCMDIHKSQVRCIEGVLSGNEPILSLILFSILFSTIPLFFLKEAVYKTWRNFSLVFIPLMLIFIFTSPEYNSGLFGTTNLFNRESATFVGFWAYLILSYIIIAIKAWRVRGEME
jgi:hypothetical protein